VRLNVSGGKLDLHFGAGVGTAIDGNGAAVQEDDAFDDGKSESDVSRPAGAGTIGAVEAVEDFGQIIRVDPGAGVGDLHGKLTDLGIGGEFYGSAFRCVPNCIGDEISNGALSYSSTH
jgi:hypothetical protein